MTPFFSNQIVSKTVTFIVLILFIQLANAETESADRQINVPKFKGTAKQLIEQISKDENLVFAYSSEVSLDFEVSFEKKQMSLTGFLDLLFKGKPVSYRIKGDKVQLYPQTTTSSESIKLTQVVRGNILDGDSKLPLPGAAVTIVGTEPLIGTLTDSDGNFRIANVPIGRINLQISFIGYDPIIMPNIEVNSGKEVVLQLNMKESLVKLDEVIINPDMKKGEAKNDMSLLSTHSISLEETKRYTGGMDDPARVVSSFAE